MNKKSRNKRLLLSILIITLLITTVFTINSAINKKENITGNVVIDLSKLNELKIKVSIPCPGHASLIKAEIKKLQGINSVDFSLPNIFTIKYDSKQISEQDILNLDIFKEYPAKKI